MPDDKPVIFTDLDGTLLDASTYSSGEAGGALNLVGRLGIPLVFCTSKTRAEIVYWRKRLGNAHPFISENGGGVFIPDGYFGFEVPGAKPSDGYIVLDLGASYERLRKAVVSLRAEGFDITGFGDMSAEGVSRLTGLDIAQARLAKKREYDEPFVLGGGKDSVPLLLAAIGRHGLKYTRGRLMHILGDCDKGRAVRLLAGLYERRYGRVVTAAIGDSPNDAPMLGAVDHPFLVRKPDGTHERVEGVAGVTKVDGIGPRGWADAIGVLVKRLGLA
jgi:mannosyl-3-phosphoglycerate phosphatase